MQLFFPIKICAGHKISSVSPTSSAVGRKQFQNQVTATSYGKEKRGLQTNLFHMNGPQMSKFARLN